MNRLLLSAIEKSLSFQRLLQAATFKSTNNSTFQAVRPLTIWNNCFLQNSDGNAKSSNARTTSKAKKTQVAPKISLIGPNNTLSVSTLEDAQKLAKRRELHLVQVEEFDSKTQRPVYKLVTAAEMIADDLKEVKSTKDAHNDKDRSLQNKSEKVLTVGARISDHDLASRLKNISKWLSKRHEVRVLIQGSPNEMANCEKLAKSIEDSVREPDVIGKIVKKQKKGASIKFYILPVENVDTPITKEPVSSA